MAVVDIITLTNDLERGRLFLSDAVQEEIDRLETGIKVKCLNKGTCMYNLISSIEYKIALDEIDEVTDNLYKKMMLLIEGYSTIIPSTVNAGIDQTVQTGQTVNFVATIVEGTYPVVNIQWTQTAGTTAILTNANTASLTVSNYSTGVSTFKVTITDSTGATASDIVNLIGTLSQVVAYYGFKNNNTVLTYSQIVAGSTKAFADQGSVLISYEVTTPSYLWFAIPVSQPDKNYYTDPTDPLNQAYIGTEETLFGAATVVTGSTNYKFYITNYQTVYSKPNPVKGLQFETR